MLRTTPFNPFIILLSSFSFYFVLFEKSSQKVKNQENEHKIHPNELLQNDAQLCGI